MEERFRYLFKKYVDNSCSREELEEFFTFVQKAGHDNQLRQLLKDVYHEHERQGILTTFVNEQGRLTSTQADAKSVSFSPALKNRWLKRLPRVAAFIVIIGGLLWFNIIRTGGDSKKNNAVFITQKATNRSESKFILLEDSTQVWLNSSSSLEFPDQFENSRREVYLSGEAFFDVKHADKTPFIIHTGAVSTTVLGTAFNIKAYPGQKSLIISVSRGKVKVTRPDGWETTLIKGQQLKLEEEGRKGIEKNVAVEEVAAWKKGSLVYDDEALADVIADLQRVYNVEIHLLRTSISGVIIGTTFKREIGIEQALQVLCKLTDTEVKLSNGVYIIQ